MIFLNPDRSGTDDKIALRAQNLSDLSYRALTSCVEKIINELKKMGIERHDLVGFMAGREPVDAIICLALMDYCVLVPINPESRSEEIKNIQNTLPLKALICRKEVVLQPAFTCKEISVRTKGWEVHFEEEKPGLSPKTVGLQENHCLILQTSGTTDLPRFVPLSKDNILASCHSMTASLALTEDDCCLHMLPLFHIGGLVDTLLAPLLAGGTIVMNRGFDRSAFFENLTSFSPTWTQTVPTMLQELVGQQNLSNGHHFRFIRSVSAPLSEDLYHKASQTFQTSIVEIYGMTETCGVITSNALSAHEQKPNSVGKSAGLEIRIKEPLGEIQVRGPSLMSGYFMGTDEEWDEDWFKTGDLGHYDEEGDLFITGRVKDIINRGGEKISPAEIDQLLLTHEGVADAAAYPIASQKLGEEVALLVVTAKNACISSSDLLAWLKTKIAYFKIPTMITFVDEIPRHKGKLQRRKLCELFALDEKSDPEKKTEINNIVGASHSALARLWAEILEEDEISDESDFFYLGGDSLVATIMMNEIENRWGVSVLISTIYDEPVFKDFQALLTDEYPQLIEKMVP